MMSLIIERARQRLDQVCLNSMIQSGESRGFKPFSPDDIRRPEDRIAIPRLLDLEIIKCEIVGTTQFRYSWTDFGEAVFHHPNMVRTS